VSVLLVGLVGAFYISRLEALRAEHRLIAHNIAKKYLENESMAGYYSGGYATVPQAETINDITYTVAFNPATPVVAYEGGIAFKTIGFEVSWPERLFGEAAGNTITCRERAATIVASH
jgi:hypothetical protein